MNLTGYRSDCQTVHQISNGLWTWSLEGIECWVYFDDVIVFSKSAEQHALRLENVLRSSDDASLQLHPGKCVFAQFKVHYLGFVLPENGVSASTDKVKAVRELPTPKNVTEVRAFFVFSIFLSKTSTKFCTDCKTPDNFD